MHNSVTVQVLKTEANLIRQRANAIFSQLEIPSLDIIIHIISSHEIEHYIIVFAVLEQVDEVDDVRVLAHLEHLDLTSLLEYFNVCHVFLFDLFDSSFIACLLMQGQLDQAELTLAESLVQCVIVEHV